MAITNAFQSALRHKLKQRKNSPIKINRPNPDPRPPNEYKPDHRGQDNQSKQNHQQGHKPKAHLQTSGAKSSSATGQSQPGQGAQQSPFAPAIDPRDSQYWIDLMKMTSERDLNLQSYNIDKQYSQTSYEQALQGLALQQPRDELNLQENANRAGAFYSSKTGEGLGQIGQQYFQQRSGLSSDFEQQNRLRQLMIDAVNSGYNIDQAQALASATARGAEAEQDRPTPTAQALSIKLQGGSKGRKGKKGNKKNHKKR